jgi:hypothetical protein
MEIRLSSGSRCPQSPEGDGWLTVFPKMVLVSRAHLNSKWRDISGEWEDKYGLEFRLEADYG